MGVNYHLSPNTLPPDAYNIICVALFFTFLGWALTAFYRLYYILEVRKATANDRVVYIEGLGDRLQVRMGG